MARKIKLRTDLHNVWEDVNPVLGGGELGVVKDKNTIKVGDGNTNFNDLPELAKDPEVVHKTGNEIIDGVKTFNDNIKIFTDGNSSTDFVNSLGQISIGAANNDKRIFFYDKEKDKDLVRIYNNGTIKLNNGENSNFEGYGMGEGGGTNTFGSQLRGTYIAPPLYGERGIKENSTFYNVGDILAYGIDKGELEVVVKDKDGNDITPSNIRDIFRDNNYIRIDNISDISPLTIEIKKTDGSNVGDIRELVLLYGGRDSYIKTGKVEVEHDDNNDGTYDWETVLDIDDADRLSSQVVPVGRWRIKTIKITVNEVGSENKLGLRNVIGIYIPDNTNSYWLSRDGGSVYGNVGIGTDNPGAKLSVNGEMNINNTIRFDGGGNVADALEINNYPTGGSGYTIGQTKNNGRMFIYNQNISSEQITLAYSGNVGILTTTPSSKLTVAGGDIETTDSGKGLILKSPNGTRYRVKVNDDGTLTTEAL